MKQLAPQFLLKSLFITPLYALLLMTGCGQESASNVQSLPCVPGRSVACVGDAGCSGVQVCQEDGQAYEACVCQGTTGNKDLGGSLVDMSTLPDAGFASDMAQVRADASTVDMSAQADAKMSPDGGRTTTDGPLLAFPGAMGYGATTKGGRGGRVIYVTSLEDSGAGTLREALEASGPRTVIFRVGGTIALDKTINVKDPFLTVAGQTAPGGGVALRHSGISGFGSPLVNVETNDVIIRHVRFRRGPSAEGECCGDNLQFFKASRIIVDHCSFSWSTDESVSGWPATEVTIQRSLISESLKKSSHEEDGMIQNHALAVLFGQASDKLSFIQNVFAHNTGRNPALGPNDGATIQVVNNLLYNTCYAMSLNSSGPRANYNAIGNTILAGEDTCGRGRASLLLDGDVSVYVKDNLTPYRKEGEDEWLATAKFLQEPPAASNLRSMTPHDTPEVPIYEAKTLEDRLLPLVGATLPVRDAVDVRVFKSIQERQGRIIDLPDQVGGWPELEKGTPYPDADQDGMDDNWEKTQGLDPGAQDGDQDKDNDGYTNLEEFLNGTQT